MCLEKETKLFLVISSIKLRNLDEIWQRRLHHGGSRMAAPCPRYKGHTGAERSPLLQDKSYYIKRASLKDSISIPGKPQHSCNFVHWLALDAKHSPNSVSVSLTMGYWGMHALPYGCWCQVPELHPAGSVAHCHCLLFSVGAGPVGTCTENVSHQEQEERALSTSRKRKRKCPAK